MSGSAEAKKQSAGWGVVLLLAAAQFVMVLDSTVMNVSISQVVADLNTTVVGIQTAITAYTLVMAALMLAGAKLGDLWGSRRAFTLGLIIYGAGSLTTALSPNLPTLLFGWSFLEGLGAVLVIPAIAALVASTYQGHMRALAFGIMGGVAGAAAAAGPIIGGWVTTYLSWRIVFASEVVIMLVILAFVRVLKRTEPRGGKLDMGGAVLSALGLGLVVFGILQSSHWGWIEPKAGVPVISGVTVAPLGLSPVIWLVAIGGFLLTMFVKLEHRIGDAGGEPLLDMRLFQIRQLRSGLSTLMAQQFITMGTFFVIPLYLQTVLGLSAFKTGVALLPLSIALLVCALGGSALSGRFSPKRIVSIGLLLMLASELLLQGTIGPTLGDKFYLSLGLLGAGLGLLASQLSNVNLSSVDPSRGGEVGGLQGTAQNLGASLGTALVGSILIASLATSFNTNIQANADLPTDVKTAIAQGTSKGLSFITVEAAGKLLDGKVPAAQQQQILSDYSNSQIWALRKSIAVVAIVVMLAFLLTGGLPKSPMSAGDAKTGPSANAPPSRA
ncbi:MAG: MFS transporter [Coriobacteriia bacterium]